MSLLETYMRPLPEGEGPSCHWKGATGLANSLLVLIHRFPMTMASPHSPLALYIRMHTARPLQAHSTNSLRTVHVLTPEPLVLYNKSVLHTKMRLWRRTTIWSCLLPREGLCRMSLQIGSNVRARQRHSFQGSQHHSNILIRNQILGLGSAQRGLL